MDDNCTVSDVVQAAPGTGGDRHEASNQSGTCARSRASFLRRPAPEDMEAELQVGLRILKTLQPQTERLCDAVSAQGKTQIWALERKTGESRHYR